MSKVLFLNALKLFTVNVTRDLRLPVSPREEDPNPMPRSPGVYQMRLPHFSDATRKAPYILHQVVTGKDLQKAGMPLPEASTVVRTVFCVYHEDGEEGALALLSLMERVRIALLERPLLSRQYELDLKAGLETLAYPDDSEPHTAPYYLGEMVSTWRLPPVERLDTLPYTGGLPLQDPWGRRREELITLEGDTQYAEKDP